MQNDLLIRQTHAIGQITLARPEALNALTHDMALQIETSLQVWHDTPAVKMILIDAQGGRAFCAGGDIQALYRQGKAQDFASGIQFWLDEYRLNASLGSYPKPIVAVMDGITMGGGVGLGCHASHRIVTEATMLALPECAIGLVPDVGSTHLLAQAPGFLGEFLALTGYRMSGAEAVYCGFADLMIPRDALATLLPKLLQTAETTLLPKPAPGPCALAEIETEVSAVFALPDLAAILAALRSHPAIWAAEALKRITAASPLSCQAALSLVRHSRANPGLPAALRAEFRFVSRAMAQGDFLEGIRASLIDKDKSPRWQDPQASDLLAAMLTPAPGGDLTLDPIKGH
jgi:enoyl-CoA hydratase